MKRKFKVILSLGCAALVCAGFAACANENEIDKLSKKGYDVSITYDPNGGKVSTRTSAMIIDMYNPDEHKDENGEVHIKLLDPLDDSRRVNNAEIEITKSGYSLVGWYKKRELVTNEAGNPVDIYGTEIQLIDKKKDSYIYPDTKKDAVPAYTYAEPWDFEEDTVDYVDEGQKFELTLYAGWLPYFEYNYYYKDETTQEWTQYATTSFDYWLAEEYADNNLKTLFSPKWSDRDGEGNVSGYMNYEHVYDMAIGSTSDDTDGDTADSAGATGKFIFPKLTGKTFKAAYLDEACTVSVDESFVHTGTYEEKTAAPVNWRQNVYVEFDEGEQYKIKTPEQLSKNPNLKGYYEIMADLDFKDVTWPALFSTGVFTGKFYSTAGNTFTLSNVSVTLSSQTSTLRTGEVGGVFGAFAETASMENVKFENVQMDIASMGTRSNEASYALLIGLIEDGATLSGVTVSGTMKLGPITPGSDFALNLIANGDKTGITAGELHLSVYGNGKYFTVNTTRLQEAIESGTVVNENGDILLTFVGRFRDDSGKTSYDIQ